MKIVTCEQARQIDRKAADKGLTTTVLTENAGRAVALEVAKALGSIEGKNILVLAGKGNNGSDGMVAARNLIDMKARATIYMSGYRDPLEDISFQSVQQRGIPLIRAEEDATFSKLEDALKSADAVIDAFLGTGRARPLEGAFKSALEKTSVSKARRPSMLIIGLDVPSGLDPDTGAVELVNYVVVDDVGTEINPLTLHGQVVGGIVQGLGQILMERIVYDGESGQLLTGSFMDYMIPRADTLPALRVGHHGVPCATNPLGVKGAGESGVAGSLPSAVNAVLDALGRRGVSHLDLPMTPTRVWAALRGA